LYYYLSDQINSTRMITDETGAVVYSAAYDPYGGIQKTWVSTYNPALKFSGKEWDSESGLDYFGARYSYAAHYRWLSVDPVINREEALANPQLWDLYAYCRNNPATYWDPDGMDVFESIVGWWQTTPLSHFVKGDFEQGLKIIAEQMHEDIMSGDMAMGFAGGVKITKNIPNPYGKMGGLQHRSKVKEILDAAKKEGGIVTKEVEITIPEGGFKTKKIRGPNG